MQNRLVFGFIASTVLFASSAQAAPISLSVVRNFDPLADELPEAITTDGAGNIYLSMGTTVRRLTPWGDFSVLTALPLPPKSFALGLRFGPDGALYAASGAFTPEPSSAFVWRISPVNGATEQFAALDPFGFPNDLAFDGDGQMLVTDPFLGLIWKIDDAGVPDVWLADPLLEGNPLAPAFPLHAFGVDGIAFDRLKDNVYVGNFDYGRIVRIEVDADGEPGAVDVWYEDHALLAGADGLAFDDLETLHVAVNTQDRLVTIDRTGVASIIAEGAPLDGPSSLVFGRTPFDLRTLYVSSFAVSRAFFLKPGPARPALLKGTVAVGGLRSM